MQAQNKLSSIVINLLIAIPTGILFFYLRIPLPWLLGPIIATLSYHSISNNRACWPVSLRDLALIVVGYSLGRAMTYETAQQILFTLPSIIIVTLLTLMFSMLVGYLTHQKTGISLASGILGSMPGGLMQMVLLSEEIRNADITAVILMQTLRILTVVFMVPFIATYGLAHPDSAFLFVPASTHQGVFVTSLPAIVIASLAAWLAYRLKLPIPFLIGPIFGTAAAVLCGYPALPVPRAVFNMAQISVGIYMGLGITLRSLRSLRKLFPYAMGGAVALVVFAFLLGLGLTWFIPATLLTTFLSTAPGGMAEMGMTAIALQADIATVLAYQLFRLFSILLAVPPLLKWGLNR